MTLNKKILSNLIREILILELNEQNQAVIPITRPSDSPPQQEDPIARKKRLKQKFAKEQERPKPTFDPETQEGRNDIIESIRLDFGDIIARINILNRLASAASASADRKEFKENLIQIFDNLDKMSNRDMRKIIKSYVTIANHLNISFPSNVAALLRETNFNPDTPEGRKNLLSNVISQINTINKIASIAKQLFTSAAATSSSVIFKNEIKLLGVKIAEIRSQLEKINASFIEAFKNYEKQRGR